MTKTIKLVVVDVDGTLLNSKQELTERAEKAFKAAIDQGVQVVLATGKTRFSTRDIVERLNLTTPGIYLQGLAIYNGDGTLRHQQTLDVSIARQVITFAEDRGYAVLAYTGSNIIMRAPHPFLADFGRFQEPAPDFVGPLQNILGEMPINKLVVVGDPHRVKAMRWQLSMQLNGSIRLMQSNLPSMLEVLPPGASKGVALKVLLREMDVPTHEVMAVGDGENDIEMIQLAGIGVAMGNADEKTREAADYVVASNDEDGVAEAIERFVLIKEEIPEPGSPVQPENAQQVEEKAE